MPVILHLDEQAGSKPTKRFRDTIGDRVVAGMLIAVLMLCYTFNPWHNRHYTIRERLFWCALAFIGGFIVGDRINLDRLIPLNPP